MGEVVAIEIESGHYFIAKSAVEAVKKGKTRHPNKIFYLKRIGYKALYSFK